MVIKFDHGIWEIMSDYPENSLKLGANGVPDIGHNLDHVSHDHNVLVCFVFGPPLSEGSTN